MKNMMIGVDLAKAVFKFMVPFERGRSSSARS
jgi:hypothetical protein